MTEVALENGNMDTHAEEARLNKISNEEFKIWKKAVPTFYQHISTFKPCLQKHVTNQSKLQKTVTFTDKMFPDMTKGTLTTSVLLALGSDIYEIDVILPIGAHLTSEESSCDVKPQYEAFLKTFEQTKFEPKWKVENNDTVAKLYYLNTSGVKFIAVTTNGSILWFRDEITTAITSCVAEPQESGTKVDVRSDISSDLSTIAVITTITKDDIASSTIKIVDNVVKVGDVKRTIYVKDNFHCGSFKFVNGKDSVVLCDNHCTFKLWDLNNADDTPSFVFTDNTEGKLTVIGTSKIVSTLFATGSDNGTIKLWDLRSLSHNKTFEVGKDTDAVKEIALLSHFDDDAVSDIIFSSTSACKFVTVGRSGNVYHWDMEYLFSKEQNDEKDSKNSDEESIASSALQAECLSFYHTGGFRRLRTDGAKRNTVACDSVIDDLVCTVDADDLLTVYIPFTARVASDSTD
ncbi:similar to Saccharomyces cerevisiae YPL139C UME1 Negative regulator of meiosis [Maudiozyma saulgeensis]|uniref:Similar to Saccharomyces cerevisiae YPL139C UME1 Negative regulator of meiosis n=1 Tax=Maudiozyma saulgeensis TaxID=1789683 RepID=A0A1X7R900_9SACH|nr:similar to Saccharomyces cerevisiae YPL139C UME1 Negative regulator of meiosis [Kazachstania saulgeensis]